MNVAGKETVAYSSSKVLYHLATDSSSDSDRISTGVSLGLSDLQSSLASVRKSVCVFAQVDDISPLRPSEICVNARISSGFERLKDIWMGAKQTVGYLTKSAKANVTYSSVLTRSDVRGSGVSNHPSSGIMTPARSSKTKPINGVVTSCYGAIDIFPRPHTEH